MACFKEKTPTRFIPHETPRNNPKKPTISDKNILKTIDSLETLAARNLPAIFFKKNPRVAFNGRSPVLVKYLFPLYLLLQIVGLMKNYHATKLKKKTLNKSMFLK